MAGTPAFSQPPHTAVAAAMSRSFRNWAARDPKYKRTFKKLGDGALGIIDAALSELYEYKPFAYHHWWSVEHMRFRHVKNEQTRLVYELMYEFLSRYAHGRLADDNDEKQTKRKKRGRSPAAQPQ